MLFAVLRLNVNKKNGKFQEKPIISVTGQLYAS